MKRIIALLMAVFAIFTLVSCTNDSGEDGSDVDKLPNDVIIVVEGYGEIHVTLTPQHAPITVANFKKLVADKAYDGTIFHRVIYDFMIQGGDTTMTSYGETEAIKGEFFVNGVKNNLLHERGVISMARANDMDSASSQFFICQKNQHILTENMPPLAMLPRVWTWSMQLPRPPQIRGTTVRKMTSL